MISVSVDTAKMAKLKEKFDKYPPYALKQGLNAANQFLNDPGFKETMYPPDQNGSPFVWSSERQRRYVFANVKLPYSRTGGMAASGTFTVNESSFWIEYSNTNPWWIYVNHPSYQIIGHRTRGWKPINQFVVSASGKVVPIFKKGALAAWQEMDSFITGGGAGL